MQETKKLTQRLLLDPQYSADDCVTVALEVFNSLEAHTLTFFD